MTTTTNMGLTQSTVGTTTGPDWATNAENNLLTIDAHDHTSGKGVQLTPSSLNINADLEFNLNSATELKNVVLDNAVHASASGDTNNSVYEYDGNLYWRNASGGSVQITSGTAVNTSGGSISGMTGNAQVLFSSNSYAFKFDSSLSDPGIAKISHADIDLYKYDAAGSAAKVTLKFLGTGTSAALTVPDETGTLLSTATSFAGTINVATSSSNAPINLKPNGTGHVAVGNGGASGKLTSNGAFDLVLDTNSGTNSGSITITDAANGNITFAPNGTGEIVIGSGSASGKITSNGAYDLVLDTNSGTNSGNITITDGANGDITIDTNGTGDINLTGGADVNIPANIGLTFGDDGEKIEGDGTDLTIASSAILNINTGSSSGNDLKVNTSQLIVEGDTGNVLVGKTTADTYNNTNGIELQSSGLLTATRAGIPQILNREDSDGDIAVFRKDGSSVGSIGVDGGDNLYLTGETGNSGGIYMNDAAVSPAYQGAERDNYYDLGKTAARWKDLYLSSGVRGTSTMDITVPENNGAAIQMEFGNDANTTRRTVQFYKDNIQPATADDGVIGLGKSTNRFSNLYLSGGINFGTSTSGTGTVTGGVLDDYEEGTFTYTLPTSTSGSYTPRSGYTTGYYTKIGRTVTIGLRFESQGSSSPTGELQLSGLPFNTASNPSGGFNQYAVPTFLRGTTGTSASFFLYISASSAIGTFVKLSTDGSYSVLDSSDINGGASGNFEGTLIFTYVTD